MRAVVVTLALYLAACGDDGGQVCTQPDLADCPTDNGGEVHP